VTKRGRTLRAATGCRLREGGVDAPTALPTWAPA